MREEILDTTQDASGAYVVAPQPSALQRKTKLVFKGIGGILSFFVGLFAVLGGVYLLGSLMAWSLDPGQWGWLWRANVFFWMFFWGIIYTLKRAE